jgi:hypothetical protein
LFIHLPALHLKTASRLREKVWEILSLAHRLYQLRHFRNNSITFEERERSLRDLHEVPDALGGEENKGLTEFIPICRTHVRVPTLLKTEDS